MPARFGRLVPVVALLLTAGCGGAAAPRAGAPSTPPVPPPTASIPVTTAPVLTTTAPVSASTTTPPVTTPPVSTPVSCVDTLLASLNPHQRAAQLVMVGVPAGDPAAGVDLVSRGGVGGVFLRGRSAAPLRSVAAGVAALQRAATAAGGVPLHVSADQEGGQVQTLSGTGMPLIPAALAQGRLSTTELAEQTRAWGAALRSAGVTINLGPVADVVPAGTASDNPPIGAVDRAYGSTPDGVAAAVQTVVGAAASVGLLSTVKHFPGLGRVTANPDTSTRAVDPVASPTDPALAPFATAIGAGAAAVMISSAGYPNLDPDNLAVFSPAIITGLLRTQLGFTGVVSSDDLGAATAVAAVAPGQRAVRFVEAGGDVVLTIRESDVAEMTAELARAAAGSSAFRAHLDASVARVLASKVAAGLVRC